MSSSFRQHQPIRTGMFPAHGVRLSPRDMKIAALGLGLAILTVIITSGGAG